MQTLDKAIEIQQLFVTQTEGYFDDEDIEAAKLGIEALKKIQDIRARFPTLIPDLLPGEAPQ